MLPARDVEAGLHLPTAQLNHRGECRGLGLGLSVSPATTVRCRRSRTWGLVRDQGCCLARPAWHLVVLAVSQGDLGDLAAVNVRSPETSTCWAFSGGLTSDSGAVWRALSWTRGGAFASQTVNQDQDQRYSENLTPVPRHLCSPRKPGSVCPHRPHSAGSRRDCKTIFADGTSAGSGVASLVSLAPRRTRIELHQAGRPNGRAKPCVPITGRSAVAARRRPTEASRTGPERGAGPRPRGSGARSRAALTGTATRRPARRRRRFR
jgi:hypothetical protein